MDRKSEWTNGVIERLERVKKWIKRLNGYKGGGKKKRVEVEVQGQTDGENEWIKIKRKWGRWGLMSQDESKRDNKNEEQRDNKNEDKNERRSCG